MKAKVLKLVIDNWGSFLGMEKGCYILRDKRGNEQRFPMFEQEIGEVLISSGNTVSIGALCNFAFWDVDVIFLTQRGEPIAYLKAFDDDSHVKTRVCQYEALNNGKAKEIAKQIVIGKIEGQNEVLKKYGLRQHDILKIREKINSINHEDIKTMRKSLLPIEGKATDFYFKQIFPLFPNSIRVENRKTFHAYDGLNNLLNLGYTILKYKVQRAIIKAKLEPYLGFLHAEAHSKPSLVCDLMEIYRFLVDDFLIGFSETLSRKDFIYKEFIISRDKLGKRQVLNNEKSKELTRKLNEYLDKTIVEIKRFKHGNQQTLETLIQEEAYLLAKYIRNEKETWKPRIPKYLRWNCPCSISQ